jgi:hypothetical protein
VWLLLPVQIRLLLFALDVTNGSGFIRSKKDRLLGRARFLSYFNSFGIAHDTILLGLPMPQALGDTPAALSAPILGENQIFPHGKMRKSHPNSDSKAITKLPEKEELNGQKVSVS